MSAPALCLKRASFVFTILRPLSKALGFLVVWYSQTSPLFISSKMALMYTSGWEGNGDTICYDFGVMDGMSVNERYVVNDPFKVNESSNLRIPPSSLLSIDATCKSQKHA